ncbi:MAG: DUF5615 family PIN-like protein [Rhodospirillaceae bacterium]|nr:DUF5615 family PIN-like protein [Rhodospirillaceae bacterium]
MKLLFDENLSFNLPLHLGSAYPDSSHVRLVGLRGASDTVIWDYARNRGFILVSKDDDFRSLSLINGAPPKVILLKVGNGGTQEVARLLRMRLQTVESFASSSAEAMLVLQSVS